MNKFVLISSVAALSLISGMAGAVTLKNSDSKLHHVHATVDGKTSTIALKSGASYDSKGKDASLTVHKSTISGKGTEAFEIKKGKIETVKPEAAPASEATKTAAPDAVK